MTDFRALCADLLQAWQLGDDIAGPMNRARLELDKPEGEGPSLQWTDNMPPSEACRYDHCIAETPFGRFLITWKSWKEYDSPTVDETPWGDWYAAFNSVDDAKAACQQGMNERLTRCGTPATSPAPAPEGEGLRQIGHQLRTQDNRCTANPIFQVRGKERIYGLDSIASDEIVWMDDEWNPVDIPENADPEEPPHGLTVARYTTRWKVLMVAFTEQGCKEHLRLNGHNYRIFDEVGIYVDSLNRCPEMIAIREFLLGLPAPQAGEVEA
jgi:hypothetical protein